VPDLDLIPDPDPDPERDRPQPDPAAEASSLQSYAPGATRDFDAFYAAQRERIARALALALGDVDLAIEATDEALTRAFERWDRVSTLRQPEGWVYRVASNWAVSIFRRRRLGLHRFHEPTVAPPPSGDPAVHAAVAALDRRHRSVVVCRHLLGWSVADTATALGISEGTVKSRLSRANATLRVHLQDLDPTSRKEPS
jgi:RNA polymerase sigma-70 factor (ECF subfamily)